MSQWAIRMEMKLRRSEWERVQCNRERERLKDKMCEGANDVHVFLCMARDHWLKSDTNIHWHLCCNLQHTTTHTFNMKRAKCRSYRFDRVSHHNNNNNNKNDHDTGPFMYMINEWSQVNVLIEYGSIDNSFVFECF